MPSLVEALETAEYWGDSYCPSCLAPFEAPAGEVCPLCGQFHLLPPSILLSLLERAQNEHDCL